jgi:hypothetical protein
MVRKGSLLAVLVLMFAPAFFLGGCQTSSSDRPSAVSGDNQTGHAAYPKDPRYSQDPR